MGKHCARDSPSEQREGAVIMLVAGLFVLLLGSCSRLDVVIGSCNKNPTVEVEESIKEILLRVEVQSRLELFSGDCLDGVSIERTC